MSRRWTCERLPDHTSERINSAGLELLALFRMVGGLKHRELSVIEIVARRRAERCSSSKSHESTSNCADMHTRSENHSLPTVDLIKTKRFMYIVKRKAHEMPCDQ
jgi:hypothetical protein